MRLAAEQHALDVFICGTQNSPATSTPHHEPTGAVPVVLPSRESSRPTVE